LDEAYRISPARYVLPSIPVPPFPLGRIPEISLPPPARFKADEVITPPKLECIIPVDIPEKVIVPDEVKPVAPVMDPAFEIPPDWLSIPLVMTAPPEKFAIPVTKSVPSNFVSPTTWSFFPESGLVVPIPTTSVLVVRCTLPLSALKPETFKSAPDAPNVMILSDVLAETVSPFAVLNSTVLVLLPALIVSPPILMDLIMNKRIYLDMDGVLVNWTKHYEKWAREHTSTTHPNYDAMTALNRHKYAHCEYTRRFGKNFWATIPWMEWGKELYNYCSSLCDTYILTAPSNHGSSAHGKMEWINRELRNTKFIITPNKYLLANSNSLLIDDTDKKVKSFLDNGGCAFLFKEDGSNLSECYKTIDDFLK
jgi:5'(3')-deoxyribonucleotidase